MVYLSAIPNVLIIIIIIIIIIVIIIIIIKWSLPSALYPKISYTVIGPCQTHLAGL